MLLIPIDVTIKKGRKAPSFVHDDFVCLIKFILNYFFWSFHFVSSSYQLVSIYYHHVELLWFQFLIPCDHIGLLFLTIISILTLKKTQTQFKDFII
jgi:hypothetical protein